MSVTQNLRMRAESIADEVRQKIRDNGGQIEGSIDEIGRRLGVYCSNNQLRVALSILHQSGWLIGTPLDAKSQGLPAKEYLYVSLVNPRQVLLYRLRDGGMINRCGTAADYIAELGLVDETDPVEFDTIIRRLIDDRLVKAPLAVVANNTSKLEFDVYLYLAQA